MSLTKNRYDDDGSFNAWPAYQAWLKKTNPVEPLTGIAHLPISIIHDGQDTDHGPLSHSVDFVEQARAMGQRPRFEHPRNQNPPPRRVDVFKQQVTWLAQQRRAETEPLSFSADTMQGPLSRVFARRFVLVEATGGTENEQAANRKLSVAFQEAWRRTNYGPCRVVKDRELPTDEEQHSHLVLLGNAETNSVWKRLAPALPITAEPSRIVIDGRTFTGESLAFQAWFPHPTITGKKVVLIGAARAEDAVFGTLELSLDGWFDYAIWKKELGLPVLMAAERINAMH